MCFTLNISDLGFTKFTIIVLMISAVRGRGGAGIKILNPSPPRPGVRGQNIAPSPPHHLCGAGKTRAGRGGAKLPYLKSVYSPQQKRNQKVERKTLKPKPLFRSHSRELSGSKFVPTCHHCDVISQIGRAHV